jgi:hypothetical protein
MKRVVRVVPVVLVFLALLSVLSCATTPPLAKFDPALFGKWGTKLMLGTTPKFTQMFDFRDKGVVLVGTPEMVQQTMSYTADGGSGKMWTKALEAQLSGDALEKAKNTFTYDFQGDQLTLTLASGNTYNLYKMN